MAEVRFSKSHEWVRVEPEGVTIGISDHAQQELGDIVFLELPKVGDTLKKGERFGVVESTKAASELYSPVDAQVLAVNNELATSPQLVNESPLDKGWMVKARPAAVDDVKAMMDEEAYKEFIASEKH